MNHPGYYWLAYDHTNLLPSCRLATEERWRRRQARTPASLTSSPRWMNEWASRPEEIAKEQPALLNPWLPRPTTRRSTFMLEHQ